MYNDAVLPQGMSAKDVIEALKQNECIDCLQDLKVKGGIWELSPSQVGGVLVATDIW